MAETRVALPGPRMPADYGLTGLGFLMVLGGFTYALFMGMIVGMLVMSALIEGGELVEAQWYLAGFGALSVVRSVFHWRAGNALLYGSPGGALGPTRVYLVVAAAHTAAAVFFLSRAARGDEIWIVWVAALAAWPVVVAALALRTPPSKSADETLPRPADGGYESLAVLMTVFGLLGVCLMGAFVAGIAKARVPLELETVAIVVVLLLLLARSALHVRAGVTGLRGGAGEAFHRAGSRYVTVGILASIAAGVWVLLSALAGGAPGEAVAVLLIYALLLAWLLLAWPRIVWRFLEHRRAERDGPVDRRAADRGMTALGWLMLALGASGLAMQIAGLFVDSGAMRGDLLMPLATVAAETDLHQWTALGAGAITIWAGVEIVRMTSRFRIAAVAYGVVGLVTTVIINLESFALVDRLGAAAFTAGPDQGAVMLFVGVISSMIVPVTAIVLALRREQAQARVLRS